MSISRSDIINAGFIHLSEPHSLAIWNDVKRGTLGNLLPQYDGVTYEYSVKAEKDDLAETYSSKGLYDIAPHTDGLSMDKPPRFLVLYCIVPDEQNLCITSFCSAHIIQQKVNRRYLDIIDFPKPDMTPFKYGFYLGVYGTDNKQDLNVDNINRMKKKFTQEKQKACDAFMECYNKDSHKLLLKKGDILLLDNHYMLHSRSSHYSLQRHLYRYWVE